MPRDEFKNTQMSGTNHLPRKRYIQRRQIRKRSEVQNPAVIEIKGSMSPATHNRTQSGIFQVVPHANSKLNNSQTGFRMNFGTHMENFKKIRKQFLINGNMDFDVN